MSGMSEYVFKSKLVELLRELQEVRPAKNPVYIEKLVNIIENEETIALSELIDHLARAGYDMKTILDFLVKAGIITSSDDIASLRAAIRRAVLRAGEE